MACYSFGYILGSLISTPSLYDNFGRRKVSQCGLLLLSFSLLVFGLAYYIPTEERVLFGLTSILARSIEGVSTAFILGGIIPLLSAIYPN